MAVKNFVFRQNWAGRKVAGRFEMQVPGAGVRCTGARCFFFYYNNTHL